MRILLFIMCLLVPAISYAASDLTADHIKADDEARALAYAAEKGDQTALAQLRKQAAVNVPSSEYGLGKWAMLERQSLGVQVDGLFDLVDDYVSQNRDSLATQEWRSTRKKIAATGGSPQTPDGLKATALYDQAISLWKKAAQQGDPAAEAELGQEYWNTAVRLYNSVAWAFHVTGIAGEPLPPDGQSYSESIEPLRWMCDKSKGLLQQSMQQKWPDAFVDMSLQYMAISSSPPALNDTGCLVMNSSYSDQLIMQSVELGSVDGTMILTLKYWTEGNSQDAIIWYQKLAQMSRDNLPGASDDLVAVDKETSGELGSEADAP